MASITLRSAVGRPLTNSEVDANFSALNLELGQKLVASLNLLDLPNPAQARSNLGLGNVENKSSSTIRGELTSGNVTGALGYTPLSTGGGSLSGQLTLNYASAMHRITDGSNTLSLGLWDGANVRIESVGRPMYLASYGGDITIGNVYGSGSLVVGGSGVSFGGNTVLHAGNFTNYSPSLTGFGASGNWGINITGNAGTASAMRSSYAGDVGSVNNASIGFVYNYNSVGVWSGAPFGMGYGSVYTLGGNAGSANILSLQIAADVNHNSASSTKQLWFRTGNNLGFNNDWKEIFHSGNYSNYALPLSGGNLSGNIAVVTGSYPRIGVSDNTSNYRGLMEWDGTAGNAGVRLRNTDNSNFWLNTNGIDFLKSDLSGRITMPYQPAFMAYNAEGQYPSGVLAFNSTRVNRGSVYNTSNGRFTAPIAGTYLLSFDALCDNNSFVHGFIRINGINFNGNEFYQDGVSNSCISKQVIWFMNAGDYADVALDSPSRVHQRYGSFNGYLIG